MASQEGIFPATLLSPDQALYPQHNVQSTNPGLPMRADVISYQGTLVAYDPANSEARPADPAMPITARVIGVTESTVNNAGGAKGAKTVRPRAGVWRVKSDGNLTAAHLYRQVRVVDDHTVGVPAGANTDRFAGLLVGLDGGYAIIVIDPPEAARGPATLAAVATANASDLATAQALANALKTAFNTLHTELVARGIVAP
jgi:hypothetical protein